MKQIDRLLDKPCFRRHGAPLLLVAGLLCLQFSASVSTPIDDSSSSSSGSISSSESLELTACQHLRRAEARRAKSLGDSLLQTVRIPRCTALGDFEPVQCSNELNGTECWCVDEYGVEITGSRRSHADDVNCTRVENECQASSCRMFCPAGFAKDLSSGCPICRCRDPCEDIQCPRGQQCEPQEVQCKTEPCPPVPTCRKARSLNDLCPAGQPLAISGTVRPFLCGNDPGKPSCPPLYRCLVQGGNDYGVCCPASLQFEKPGSCPKPDEIESSASAGFLCGTPCGHDLECPQMQKCCQSNGCGRNCQQPHNVTVCHQARMLSELLSVNEREGRGYVPQCEGPGGSFSTRQCSRNGLVCWCVDPRSGNKIKGTMGAAATVNCDGVENMIGGRAGGRSVDGAQTLCDHNICAAVCEYGFKNDHNGCPTCECSEPCEGYLCPGGLHCEVAKDPKCEGYSGLCSSEPVCKPDLVYSNPCEIGTPLADNVTGELLFCHMDRPKSREYQSRSFFDDDEQEESETNGRKRSMSNTIVCPVETHECRKLHGESRSVCCPLVNETDEEDAAEDRQQTMCEYLRDFSDRMEGTVEGMELALPPPACTPDGGYQAMQCVTRVKKVKASEQRKYIEQNSIRRMRKLLEDAVITNPAAPLTTESSQQSTTEGSIRARRAASPDATLKLLPVDSSSEPTGTDALMAYIRQRSTSAGAELILGRSAKIIDFNRLESKNGAGNVDKVEIKPSTLLKRPLVMPTLPTPAQEQLVEVEIEECWCADGFGTEIPKTRGFNASTKSCEALRESLGCLDLTCRMGCDYGFVLDPDTQCPSCECRDPCDTVSCPDGQECRSVEVSCEGEYCPPVPACFPKKPGQCPFLVPPGAENSESDSCEYECRTDAHCDGSKRCCSNGCGTQCVEPQLKTACQHLQTIQLHQASELGIPPKQKYIAQCDIDGSFRTIQCGPGNVCWCVDEFGNEKSGTRTSNGTPDCELYPKTECPLLKCRSCEYGYKIDANGCKTCDCRDPCGEISCPRGEECQLIQVECISVPCPKMPICVPIRESVCPEATPLRSNGREIVCGPQADADSCPSTHICQLHPISNRGVCCGKTRDVCFESIDQSCLAADTGIVAGETNELDTSITRWRFSPRLNKCVPVMLPRGVFCQSKNLFHSESACNGVCPVLSQCERLRLKNAMAAKRAGQPNTWFQPRCDPETGFWSPVQCLGSMAPQNGSTSTTVETPTVGVCWCADKKGAPVKGSLTKGSEPKCSSRQARRRGDSSSADTPSSSDPVMEELIRQITFLVDENNYLVDEELEPPVQPVSVASTNYAPEPRYIGTVSSVTEKVIELARTAESRNFISDAQDSPSAAKRLSASATRCQALQLAASFPVACDANGAFEPMQCNGDTCWCVDAAGNQLPLSSTFKRGARSCLFTPIEVVEIELRLNNVHQRSLIHVYETLRAELSALIGSIFDNYRVQENSDGSVTLRFDLIEASKVDDAYAIEEMVREGVFALYHGHLIADMTQSRFAHRISNGVPLAQPSSGIPENTFQTIVFVLATASAFLVAIFVVFVMLKRGRGAKTKHYASGEKIFAIGADKYVDYSSPIFVLSANDSQTLHRSKSSQQQQQQPGPQE